MLKRSNRKFKITCWLIGIFTTIFMLPSAVSVTFRCFGIQVDWSLFTASEYLQGILIALGIFGASNVTEKFSKTEQLATQANIDASKIVASDASDATKLLASDKQKTAEDNFCVDKALKDVEIYNGGPSKF